MSRNGSKKRRGGREQSVRVEERGSRLDDVFEVLLHVLALQACPACGGFGRQHVENDAEGKPVLARCECRRRAAAFLHEFGFEGFEVEEPSPEVEPSEKFEP